MRKIKAKPVKTPKIPRGQTVIIVSDPLTFYQLSQAQYDKHCLHQLSKRIFAALRGATVEEDSYV